jgi:MATE family multidrug resistance protein
MTLSQADFDPPADTAAVEGRRLFLAEGLSLIRLALPIMLIALVNMGMSITDTAMVSLLFGADALAAVAVGSDLYSILFYLGAGTLAGLAPSYASAVVRSDPTERARLERIGQCAVALLAMLLVPLLWSAPDWLAALELDPALLGQGRGYTRAMALTLLPMLGVALYRTILTAAERPTVFLWVTLAMLPVNAAANYALMTGAGPVPAFGPTGAALTTLCVATMSLLVLVLVARCTRPCGRVASLGPAVDWRGLLSVLRVGLPIGIATVAEVGVFLGATIYAATLGSADVAAHTLALRTAGVAYAVPTALLQAAMIRMARAEAHDDPAARGAVTASGLCLALVAGSTLFGALMLGARPLAEGFFDESPEGLAAAALAIGLLMLLGLMELLAGPGSTAAGLLRGRRETRAPMLYILVGHWLVGVPVGLYLCEAQARGITGVWIGLAAGTLVSTLLTLRHVGRPPRERPAADGDVSCTPPVPRSYWRSRSSAPTPKPTIITRANMALSKPMERATRPVSASPPGA